MCGIAGIVGRSWEKAQLEAMVACQRHRGPDGEGLYLDPHGLAGLGHNRLSIIDLSDAGRQPMASHDGRLWLVFNGEIYNYRELRSQLHSYPFQSQTDTEVILAAYERWGEECLERFIGMFSFLLWDEKRSRLLAARDRFGVKPLHYRLGEEGTLFLASEIKALHASGSPREPDPIAWSSYLGRGLSDNSERTFWRGVSSVPAGHVLTWSDGQTRIDRWYSLEDEVGIEEDRRPVAVVQEEYRAVLAESIALRFRSDVPVGINLSGGLDSSTLFGLIQLTHGANADAKAFTFVTGDPAYDELPWVKKMLEGSRHPSIVCSLEPADVPELARSVQAHEEEPFGGLPTLAYARLFERAREEGVVVLLDGQGMDEQWAGYDYYRAPADRSRIVQGTGDDPLRADCLAPEFRDLARDFEPAQPFPDRLRNLQYRDVTSTKLPRALRFNDRISMRSSTELREPFLDHRLVELAFRQPRERKISNGTGKWLLRQIVHDLLPNGIVNTPKRPVQTPQREWLRGPLQDWAEDCLQAALDGPARDWLLPAAVEREWKQYRQGVGDNSFFVWQWISLGLILGE